MRLTNPRACLNITLIAVGLLLAFPRISALAQTPPTAPTGQPRPDAGTILDSTRQPVQPVPQLPRNVLPKDGATPNAVADSTPVAVKRLEIEGATLIPADQLRALVADLEGKTVTFGDLRAGAERITKQYVAAGYFLSRALIPPQDAKDGVIRIRVVEAKYGNVKVVPSRNAPSFALNPDRASALLAAQGAAPGAPVQRANLERGLYLLNDLPGVEADATLVAGATPGTTDANVNVKQPRPVTGSVSLDNLGNRYTGAFRLGAGISLNSPLGVGDRLYANANASSGAKFITGGYTLPVGLDGLKLGVNASSLSYKLCCLFATVGAQGRVNTAAATVTYPFILSQAQTLVGGFSYERRRAVDDVTAGNFSDRKIGVSTANLNWVTSDALGGINNLNAAVTFGNLNLDGNAFNATNDGATARTAGGYAKWRASFARLQQFGERHSLLLRLSGQGARKNLDSSEKMSIGGYDGVRAYPQGEAAGDEALLASVEYAYALPVQVPGRIQLSSFLDAGHVRLNKSIWPGFQGPRLNLPNSYSLAGVGLGVNWSLPQDFSVNLNVATKLGKNPGRSLNGEDADGYARSTRWWLVMSKSL